MTYPPQPGQSYEPRPGAYGQGGYPQQQGPFPPGGGHPQPFFGSGGGYPPPEPKKTGLWIGLTAGVLVVVAFLVTAFAAPVSCSATMRTAPRPTARRTPATARPPTWWTRSAGDSSRTTRTV
ncbi:hypothetical protein [Amycolatopsis thermoflava]|uniref:hypothetical protein n=1 Tax=Amycolatopsis thermoflava TaxID=84480 RepID=UPI003809763D